MTKPLCGLADCDCGYTTEKLEGGNADALRLKEEYAGPLDRLQKRFNEVWKQHQRMLFALENARDVIHRTTCPTPPSLPQKCWKECEEAEDAMLEAGWVQP